MPTTRETVLPALHAQLQPLAALILRDEVLPERIPASGLTILRDGQPGEPEVTLSPLRYHYQHRAELGSSSRQAPVGPTLIAAIATALDANRTLGGLCDWVEPEAPASVDLPIEGAAALKAAVITVVLHNSTTGPLACPPQHRGAPPRHVRKARGRRWRLRMRQFTAPRRSVGSG